MTWEQGLAYLVVVFAGGMVLVTTGTFITEWYDRRRRRRIWQQRRYR